MKIIVIFILALLEVAWGQFVTGGVNCSDIKVIVDKHNELRRSIANGTLTSQPKASNMKKMVWDNKLQAMAQAWANQMNFAHNPNRTDSRFYVGENISLGWGSTTSNTPAWASVIQSFFNEYTKYTYGPCCSSGTGHYTQIAWSNTIYVGCGYTVYMKNNLRYKFYVCDYGPGGNMVGQTPYTTGAGCENLCCSTYCNIPYGTACA